MMKQEQIIILYLQKNGTIF